jgi:hypothetical protein
MDGVVDKIQLVYNSKIRKATGHRTAVVGPHTIVMLMSNALVYDLADVIGRREPRI